MTTTAQALGAAHGGDGTDWDAVLARRSFVELDAHDRAVALLDDPTSARVLLGPFDRIESPWLAPQDVTPQADDGLVVVRGTIGGAPAVVVAIEQAFQGGGIGEVSGAKVSTALRLAAEDSRAGTPTAAVLLMETGGVRLQEANLGLNAVAEVCSALLELRPLAPVVTVVAGTVGSFGGMSIATGLSTRVVVTPEARIGLNGAAVIEQEAGVAEFDSSDRALIWAVDGGEQRRATGLADRLVVDDVATLKAAVHAAVAEGPHRPGEHRSERLDVLTARVASVDPAALPEPATFREVWGDTFRRADIAPAADGTPLSDDRAAASVQPSGRGGAWLRALAGDGPVEAVVPSVLRADRDGATWLAVVPDPANRFHRARQGQVGLTECLALAQVLREIAAADAGREPRAVIAVVDLPSQAYGRAEELVGLHQTMAATTDAYVAARTAGHPVVALVVGQALSGGFLTHGLQADRILALDDPGVEIHAMHRAAAARITLRTVAELEELGTRIPPMSYAVRDWATLGFCDGLLTVEDADHPTAADVTSVGAAVTDAVRAARSGPHDLSGRLTSDDARRTRAASIRARDALTRQWSGGTGAT